MATQEIDPATFLYWLTADKIATLTSLSAQLYLVTQALHTPLHNQAEGKLKAYVYNQSSDQYTIFKEGGPGFTKYTVFTDNRKSRSDRKKDDFSMKPLTRHKSLPPKERRKNNRILSKYQGITLID